MGGTNLATTQCMILRTADSVVLDCTVKCKVVQIAVVAWLAKPSRAPS